MKDTVKIPASINNTILFIDVDNMNHISDNAFDDALHGMDKSVKNYMYSACHDNSIMIVRMSTNDINKIVRAAEIFDIVLINKKSTNNIIPIKDRNISYDIILDITENSITVETNVAPDVMDNVIAQSPILMRLNELNSILGEIDSGLIKYDIVQFK